MPADVAGEYLGQCGMDSRLASRAAVFARLLSAWNEADPEDVRALVTADYVGHLLGPAPGERTARQYPDWIRSYRAANPGAWFSVQDQGADGDRLWTRLSARLGDGSTAHGMNVSRFVGDRIAEEWALWSPWVG